MEKVAVLLTYVTVCGAVKQKMGVLAWGLVRITCKERY